MILMIFCGKEALNASNLAMIRSQLPFSFSEVCAPSPSPAIIRMFIRITRMMMVKMVMMAMTVMVVDDENK